jgi:vacuole morphology and inheritance protein 14
MDDATFPALLRILSDSSEEVVQFFVINFADRIVKVIKHDLILLAQISSTSTEADFRNFMIKLLDLFSTDRRLLDSRGSLIIRQLCLSLQTERIYKSFAEILEKEEVRSA